MISENVCKVFCCLFRFRSFWNQNFMGSSFSQQQQQQAKTTTKKQVNVKKKELMFLCFFPFLSSHFICTFCNRIKYLHVNTIVAYFANFAFPFYVFFYLSRTHAIMIIKFSLETFWILTNKEKERGEREKCASRIDIQHEMVFSFWSLLVQKLNGDCSILNHFIPFNILDKYGNDWNYCHCLTAVHWMLIICVRDLTIPYGRQNELLFRSFHVGTFTMPNRIKHKTSSQLNGILQFRNIKCRWNKKTTI